jgi:hypothetical protein
LALQVPLVSTEKVEIGMVKYYFLLNVLLTPLICSQISPVRLTAAVERYSFMVRLWCFKSSILSRVLIILCAMLALLAFALNRL